MELLPLNGTRRPLAEGGRPDPAPRPADRAGAASPKDSWLPSERPTSVPEPHHDPVREAPQPAPRERPLITARALLGMEPAPQSVPTVIVEQQEPPSLSIGELQARSTPAPAPSPPPASPVATVSVPPAERPGMLRRIATASHGIYNSMLSLVGKGDDSVPLEAPLAKINALGPHFAAMSDAELQGMTAQFKARIANGETLESIMPEAYAVVREAASRVLHMRPYDVQVMGAMAMNDCKIAEMGTGEGKTLTATMPAYLNALSGKGAHVVTVNQTLAERDAGNMGKLYNWLGLSVGVVPEDPSKLAEKRAAYNCDITYVTNYSLGFDFLRDNMVRRPEERVCRPPHFALIDEVDEILIDEARTPLILSETQEPSTREYQQFAQIFKTLKPGADYQVDYKQRQAWLTDDGLSAVEKQLGVDNLYDDKNMHLVPYLRATLIANTLFTRDKDYMIRDGKVEIVDEFTGRIMDGRRYNDGIHQALEAKEGVQVQPEQRTMASITYPNLFRRYEKVAGMSGTAKTEESEFQNLYGLSVSVIPPNRPSRRVDEPDLVYKTYQEKFNAIGDYVQKLYEEGKPVLIGTRNVATNEYLHQVLDARGIPHQLLNARSVQENTSAENEIIARAGKSGMVTLATNMAGRGVDIKPDLINFKEVTGEAVKAAQSGQRAVIVLPSAKEVEDARLWLGANQLVVAGGEPKASEAQAMFAPVDGEQPGQKVMPQVQLVIDDGKPLAAVPGAVVVRAADPKFSTGGLHIVGTERHESRRIDNQLKGRAGRQGTPGETQFFVSLDDELMRLFGGDKLKRIFDHLGVQKGQAVTDKMLDKAISAAQEKIESMHFDVRKNTTKYDGVLNVQRQIYYKDREAVVEGQEIDPLLRDWAADGFDGIVEEQGFGKKIAAEEADQIWTKVKDGWGLDDGMKPASMSGSGKIEAATMRKELLAAIDAKLTAQRKKYGDETWQGTLKEVTLDSMDEGWFNHLENMQMLQSGVGLEAYAQKDPWIAYQQRGFEEWNGMKSEIEANVLKIALNG
jgi:preprotein translocase subunit SecA